MYSADDNILNQPINTWAERNGCNVIHCDPDSPDIIALYSKAVIIDRSFMDLDIWTLFIDYVAEVDGNVIEYQDERILSTIDEQIIVIDKLDLPLPTIRTNKCIQIVESGNERLQLIISALDNALISAH